MNVAFQGNRGAYSESAVSNYFGQVDLTPCNSFDDVFLSVTNGDVDAGISA